ncbi:MAG: class I SAM-dependent methyltransferase [Chloroflexi bacterium]|nr:class I SAM-dependent methyltransferase [Ktedonobacteraceae bacterium]MBV8822938.1 class I SAM-dependent methyltransferase [Ktedonobacteraceae bacterium]MBV9019520.1 class I SAM-dependent methyltransferase [Ktedonobacteraceae bacterium]MBV9708890.1 class I SAM-dependent methyltransferase [Chloroflexota bacterium]
MDTALERWQALIDARQQQMDAAFARLGRTSADFWDRRARMYYRSAKDTIAQDALCLRLRNEVTTQTTLLDVGAGTGRFSLALAPQAKHIVAVEPNATMLGYLRQDAASQRLTNISYIPSTWQEAPSDLQADIVLCNHVLYPIREVDTFLLKLRAATQHVCYIYMWATHPDGLNAHLWPHFHGDERQLLPKYIDALDVMCEMGIYADVEVARLAVSLRYASLEDAVEEQLERLILPDDALTRDKLRTLLDAWLVERDGVLVPPVDTLVGAIIRMRR